MRYPSVKRRDEAEPGARGAYTDLDQLVRLQFEATGFSFLPRQSIHSVLAGRHGSRLRGRGLNFEEIRRYLPGDDIRSIDWRVTARTRKAHVRVYTEERDRPVLLLVDQRLSMFFGTQRAMKSVVAAEAAALAAWRVLGVGDRVGALVFDDEDVAEIPPRRSREGVMRILGEVVKKNHRLRADASIQPGPGALNRALREALRVAGHDHLVCIISDLGGGDDETQRLAALLGRHNDVMLVFVYDRLEARLPEAGRLVVAGAGVQLEVDTSHGGLRDRFGGEFDERLARVRELSQRRGVPVLPIRTDRGVADQVRTLLGEAAPGARAGTR